ncbi:hypothetical protein MEO40_17770 [Dolichospermum sp. ST_sed1]|nr:hypothetical protein [Dolichospermum sp. ST_sed1]
MDMNKLWNIDSKLQEYVIWGNPANSNEEALLMSKFEGKYITDYNLALKLKSVLENKYNCTNVRVQKL